MDKMKRLQSLVNGNTNGRPFISFWKHFPIDDREVEAMVNRTEEFQEITNSDFIKITYNGLLYTKDWGQELRWTDNKKEVDQISRFIINEASDWKRVEAVSVYEGELAKYLEMAKKIIDKYKGKVPVIATVFSPFSNVMKLSGNHIFRPKEDDAKIKSPSVYYYLENEPEKVLEALEKITETIANFVKELVDYGIDGIYYACQMSSEDVVSVEQYRQFGKPFDLKVLEEIRGKTWFNIIHIHGNKPMIEELKDYPVQAISYHDITSGISWSEARKVTDKILVGGINELDEIISSGTDEELMNHLQEACDRLNDGKFILAPACTIPLDIPEERFNLIRELVDKVNYTGSIK